MKKNCKEFKRIEKKCKGIEEESKELKRNEKTN